MKKNGFTLAEVLVTLGIIGVVAALAMPALNSAVQKTKVGPTLRKFMYTIENANRMVMQEKDVDDLSEILDTSDPEIPDIQTYFQEINKNLSGGSYTKNETGITIYVNSAKQNILSSLYSTAAGEQFYITSYYPNDNSPNANTNYKGKLFQICYDMNGFDENTGKPNKYGKDQFLFVIDKNGTVLPLGSKAIGNAYSNEKVVSPSASAGDLSLKNCADTTGEKSCNTEYAAGAIANNNWKVGYKY